MKTPIHLNLQFNNFIWTLLLVVGFSSVASAATFTVTKIADTNDSVCDADCSLREAIAAANVATTDDIIEFSSFFSSPRSIRLTGGELSVAANGTLTVNGTGTNMLSISGERLSRVFYINGATATVKGLIITLGSGAGTSGGAGGGIYNLNGTLHLINAGVNSNTASTVGGAIYTSGAISLVNSTVSYNSALNGGGGIYNNGGSVVVQSSILNNNSASSSGGHDGGGIFNSGASAVLTVTDSTVRANGAQFGGGIYNVVGTLTATNTTFTNNGATVGGGISNNSGTVNLNNVTVARNSASDLTVGGGGISTGNGGAVNAHNSIIADNMAPINTAPDFAGTLTSQGYNLIGNTTGTTIVGTNVGNILGQNAFLAPPGINGAVSNFIALLSFSPAIDAADPNNFPAADQRGVPRPQDGDLNGTALPDIGAYERRPALFTVTKIDDTNDGACNADCSLREAIAAVNTSNLPDKMIAFETTAFATPRTITITGVS